MVALHTVIAIAAVIFLIIKLKFDPIVALVLGALYLGLASGIGLMETVSLGSRRYVRHSATRVRSGWMRMAPGVSIAPNGR